MLVVFSTSAVQAKKLKQDSNLVKGKLENGLTYYIYPNNHPKGEAVYRLFLKSGSVLEDEDQKGMAHFLEHLSFNGTTHFPGNSLISYLESKGAKFGVDFNAHTSFNETVFKLKLASTDAAFVDTTVMILSDWAGGLLLDSTEVEEERGVILSEWLTRTGPKHEVQNAFLLELLNDSRYSKRLTIGDTAVIKHFAHRRLYDFYQKWYNPSTMAVAVSGDVNPQEIEQLIRKWFSKFEASETILPNYRIENYDEIRVKQLCNESLDNVELNVIQLFDLPMSVQTEKDYVGYLNRSILNRLVKGRFSAITFLNPPYHKASYSKSNLLNEKGMLLGSVELIPSKIKEGIESYAIELERIFRYGFIPLEIEKVKRQYLNALKQKAEASSPVESSSFIADMYANFYTGTQFVSAKDEYKLAKKYSAKIDSVSLVKLLVEMRKPENTHYLMMAFDNVSSELPSEKALVAIFDSIHDATISRYEKDVTMPKKLLVKEPKAGSIVKQERIEAIDAERFTLSNGAKVIYKRTDNDKNKVILSGFRKGGLYAMDSTDYVNGVFAGSVVSLSGAGKFSRDALSQFLAGKSVSMRLLIEKTRSGLVGGASKENLEMLFQLLYLKWMEPKADKTVCENIKQKTIDNYLTANKTESDKYYEQLRLLLEGPSYVKRELTDSLINAELSFERLLPLFNQNFGGANNFEFIIIGDCDSHKIKTLIETYLASLPAGDTKENYVYQGPVIPTESKLMQQAVGENPRSMVSIIFQHDMLNEDLDTYKLKASLLKEVVRGRLLKCLREEMGKIYSVGVSASAMKYPKFLSRSTISFACEPVDVDTLVNRTMAELHLMAENPASLTAALDDAKLSLIAKWKANLQKNIYWSGAIRNVSFSQSGKWEVITNFDKLINEITNDDIAASIEHLFFGAPVIKAILDPRMQ